MRRYSQFILEHKFWGKSIPEILSWIDDKFNIILIIVNML